MPDEIIKPPATSNKMLNFSLNCVDTKASVKFIGDSLKQKKFKFTHGKIINIYIVYEIETSINIMSYPTLKNFCLVLLN